MRKTHTDRAIIIDIDETLVETFDDFVLDKEVNKESSYVVEIMEENGTMEKYYGEKRPHLDLFIEFCFLYFETVVIWSAGGYSYVHSVVKEIFPDRDQYPHIIFTRSDLPPSNDKPIRKVAETTGLQDKIRLDNTFILDDRFDNSLFCNPNNAILIPKFRGFKQTPNDICLLNLMNWLLKDEVVNCKDIRDLIKTRIFRDDDIPVARRL